MNAYLVAIYVVSFAILASSGASLIAVGLLNRDNCPTEESLPVWMVTAGITLVLMSLVILVYALCSCLTCTKSCRKNKDDYVGSATVCALFCACACGVLGVIFFLVWLGIWIAGTYFVVVAIKELRVPDDETVEGSIRVRK